MGLFKRLFGQEERERRTGAMLVETGVADGPLGDVTEVEVVGESYHQPELAEIAGPKESEGKQCRVGVTLRCEPDNPYDENAICVQVMGQTLGHLPRDLAARVTPRLRDQGGAVEGQGIIVGGWRDRESEGHYGLRVWLPTARAQELKVVVRPRQPMPQIPRPRPDEKRLSPAPDSDERSATLTITCEEHYQGAIAASRPDSWDRDYWPVLLSLVVVDANPHKASDLPVIRVDLNGQTVGYLTAKMSQRYTPSVRSAVVEGRTPTAAAMVKPGTKGGQDILRIRASVFPVD